VTGNSRFRVRMVRGICGAVFSLRLLGWGLGCVSELSELPDNGIVAPKIDKIEPQTILSGTWVVVSGSGFLDSSWGSLSIQIEKSGERLWNRTPKRVDDNHLKFRVDSDLFSSLGVGEFSGTLKVRMDYFDGSSRAVQNPIHWTLRESLAPALTGFSPASGANIVYLGTAMMATGTGFLLEGEGATALRLTGTFLPEGGPSAQPIQAAPIVLAPVTREELSGPFPADAVGIHPGVFDGEVKVVNVQEGKGEIQGNTLSGVHLEIGPTVLTRMEPAQASRGQWITFGGRGFVGGAARTTVRFEGSFTTTEDPENPIEYRGANALEFVPEVLSGEEMRYVLRLLQSLGETPGTLDGTFTPVVYWESDSLVGIGLSGNRVLTVLPQKQVVYVKFLPGFTDALRSFGLRNVEEQIRDRILEVNRRDYRDINVEFRTSRPTDYLEYGVIEVGGEDPNHAGLMGLDATMGKDTGNVYFDDVVGGMNAETRESGTYAYGGVFVDSFLSFSPHAPDPMESLASPRFDDLFGPFAPFLGGTPVDADEVADGPRANKIQLAVRSLGNLIGNTISHEWGHTLGLAVGPPTQYHDTPVRPNQIMNGGSDRPFAERAEIDNQGPEVWSPEDLLYLLEILPKQ
jgi:hypothetical protein